MKTITRQKSGFTLLEILVALFIFSAVVTALFTAHRALFLNTGQFESSLSRHAMAQACLIRMVQDLGALHMQLPPRYTRPDFNDPPNEDRIAGDRVDRLRFTSLAHVPLDQSRRGGLAEIRYYVHSGDGGKPVLRRSDALYPYPPFEEKDTDPVLCEDIKQLTFTYYDEAGDVFDSWDSDSPDFKYAGPVAIGIALEIGDEHSSTRFETRVALPMARKAEER